MFARIVAGIDGRAGGDDALALARALAGQDTRIALLTAFPPLIRPADHAAMKAEVEGKLRKIAGDDPRTEVVALADASPARALHLEAESPFADLVVIGSSHRGPVGRLLLGDVARSTVQGITCPLAVAPRGFATSHAGPLRTVGVGYDAGPEARIALDFASAVAKSAGARLHVLTVVQTPVSYGSNLLYTVDWPEIIENEQTEAERELAEVARKAHVPTTTEVGSGPPSTVLEEMSESVDLLVVGSRGWGPARTVILGSAADRLVHHAHCPVIVVPRPAGP